MNYTFIQDQSSHDIYEISIKKKLIGFKGILTIDLC